MKTSTASVNRCNPRRDAGPRTLLVSLRPRHADNILAGTKTFEFRRISPRLAEGDTVVVYSTAPVSAVVGRFTVSTVLSKPPEALWRRVSSGPGLTREEFLRYFQGAAIAHAIGVGTVDVLSDPISLAAIRAAIPTFAPPQSYWYLISSRAADAMLATLLNTAFSRTCNRRNVG